jgi:hypothetical protein
VGGGVVGFFLSFFSLLSLTHFSRALAISSVPVYNSVSETLAKLVSSSVFSLAKSEKQVAKNIGRYK